MPDDIVLDEARCARINAIAERLHAALADDDELLDTLLGLGVVAGSIGIAGANDGSTPEDAMGDVGRLLGHGLRMVAAEQGPEAGEALN